MTPRGFVSIVGAGPGDPDLLTRRALKRLRGADLVLYDGLVPLSIVTLARKAKHRLVSRRPGTCRLAPAAAVELMVDAARAGRRVVRLRAGDPFVLARGAEEILGLAAAGVPFEIVPGLTTASAAATVAGIPLTHRGVASGFVVVSGHSPDAYEPVLRALEPDSVTVVALMGLAERGAIAETLMARGWRPETPVAIVTNASRPGQEIQRLTLEELKRPRRSLLPKTVATTSEVFAPGVIVIGRVVEVGAVIAAAQAAAPPRRATTISRTAARAAVLQEESWPR
jgi:uroporphyrin-III C-methyltransferase/precorrin-2 dehydrogenase/sirohydrochlorin ferrochelatase